MATDEELVLRTKSYDQNPDGTYVSHKAYEEINAQVAAGRAWSKCPNCGDPYPMDREGSNSTTCSRKCFDEYLAYVINPNPDYMWEE